MDEIEDDAGTNRSDWRFSQRYQTYGPGLSTLTPTPPPAGTFFSKKGQHLAPEGRGKPLAQPLMNTERPRHYFGFNCTICETFVMTENHEWACLCPRCCNQLQQPEFESWLLAAALTTVVGRRLASPARPFQHIRPDAPKRRADVEMAPHVPCLPA